VSAASGTLDLPGHLGIVNSVGFSPNGTQIATASSDESVRLWSVVTGELIHRFCCHLRATGAAFSRDGRYLASEGQGMDYSANVWDTSTGRTVASLPGAALYGTYQGFLSMAFAADRTRLLTADWQGGGTMWDLTTGKPIRKYVAPASPTKLPFEVDVFDSADLSPDGTRVLTAGFDLRAGVFDEATGQQLYLLPEPDGGVYRAQYSHDGATILTLSADGGARLWDAATGALRFDLGHPRTVQDAAFSPDDGVVATSAGKTVRLWDVATGHMIAVLSGHTDDVVRVAFSPDGRYLATGSIDRTVRVWSVATRRQLAVLHRTGPLTDLAFSPDGALLASSAADGTVRIVRQESFLPLADLLGLASQRVTRGFTAAERARYVGPAGSGQGQGGTATTPPA
jgi:WD40 repeat protein